MNYSSQLAKDLLDSLKARSDVTVHSEVPKVDPDAQPASWYEGFAIEANVPLLGTLQEGKPPFEIQLAHLLTDMYQQLARKQIKPTSTCPILSLGFSAQVVTHFESEGYPFCLYVVSISPVEEANPGAAVARIGLALNVDSSLL